MAFAWVSLGVRAAGIPASGLDPITITAQRMELVGEVAAASQGVVLADQLDERPILRPGEVLESVPGLIVTQHSGDGKANQYFLRGFNLDHGTDFASRVEGVPVNMPTHAHGQGYSDLNFLIPELIGQIDYKKGTYFAEEGNFSAAGAADIHFRRSLEQPVTLSVATGMDGYWRAMSAASLKLHNGDDLLLGGEYGNIDGPWTLPEGYRKASGIAKYTHGDERAGFSLLAMGYEGHWHSTDQIPLRAVTSGTISRFGHIDPTDGGATHRYSVSGDGWLPVGAGRIRLAAYEVAYKLDLLSNFTYATDPVHGDQFEQYDARHVHGGELQYGRPLQLAGFDSHLRAGIQIRDDDIAPVALYRTQARVRYATVREDLVQQLSYAAYLSHDVRWTSWLRSDLGVRADSYHFDVRSSLAANSGRAADSIVSPKLALVLGPWARTEYFLDIGRGFHSNDARGTTITVDPNDGVTPVAKVSPLVRALGYEAGLRTVAIPDTQLSASIWALDLDSELLFTGDGGTTQASRATRRYGLELGAYYRPSPRWIVDADLAWSHARFTQFDAVGDRVPNAVEEVGSLGITYAGEAGKTGFFGGARLRYFGPAPLIEDNRVRSASTTLVNLEGGWHLSPALKLQLTLFNLFDRRDNDITYFYDSRLRGEPAPVSDVHFHPVEPRTLRAGITANF